MKRNMYTHFEKNQCDYLLLMSWKNIVPDHFLELVEKNNQSSL